eukprot:2517434-Prymnesium_polylepis.1
MYGFKRAYEDVAEGQYKYFHESFQQVCESEGCEDRVPRCATRHATAMHRARRAAATRPTAPR